MSAPDPHIAIVERFHGLLGPLLFAGSLQVEIAALARAKWVILLLATIGVVLSTAIVAGAFFWGTRRLGLNLPFIDCLPFGALISPTDPIAALALLRKAAVPPSLLTKITGEALFNDGTGVVLFVVLLGIAGGTQSLGFASIAVLLAQQVVGGIAFGFAVAYAGCFLLRRVDSNVLETLIVLAMPTAGYAAAELFKVSAPIAAVVMGLAVGNHGRRHAVSERRRERLFVFWSIVDNLLNLMLFGLIGLELVALAGPTRGFIGPAPIAIPIVLFARACSVAIPVAILRRFQQFGPNTIRVMTWAGLRGALSVAMALSLPKGDSRELIVAATYLVAIFSIPVQSMTIDPLVRRWVVR